MYLIGYGVVRFFIEFVGSPMHSWPDRGMVSMGQMLCILMIIAGQVYICFDGDMRLRRL